MKTEKHINVAIDGPAGAGKSTIAKRLAKDLGCIYVDTGALYRTIALNVLRSGIDPNDTAAVVSGLKNKKIDLVYNDGVQSVLLDGEDVSGQIRTEKVSATASVTSAIPEVRSYLLGLQRRLAEENSVVMDGRDIGTVVLPFANVKIFLTASAKVRADRRYKELIEKGESADYDKVLAEIVERDKRDMNREIAPLKCADDATLLDSSDLTIDGVVEAMKKIVEEKLSGR